MRRILNGLIVLLSCVNIFGQKPDTLNQKDTKAALSDFSLQEIDEELLFRSNILKDLNAQSNLGGFQNVDLAGFTMEDLIIEHRQREMEYYGDDDRIDVITNCPLEHCAEALNGRIVIPETEVSGKIIRNYVATCLIIGQSELQLNEDDSHTLKTEPFNGVMNGPLCREVRFRGEPQSKGSSGVLIDENKVLMTRHQAANIEGLVVVFGFFKENENTNVWKIPPNNIFRIESVESRGEPDWAIVKLSGSVSQAPVVYDRSEGIAEGTDIYYLGYPSGLPLKHAGSAEIKSLSGGLFRANLDAFNQASGSPVFNAVNHQLIGIISGSTQGDFLPAVIDGEVCIEYRQCIDECMGIKCVNIGSITGLP